MRCWNEGAACTPCGANATTVGPEDVATGYLEALYDGDIGTACELSSTDYQTELFGFYDGDTDVGDCDALQDAYEVEVGDAMDDFSYDYEIGEVSETGDTAEVDVTQTIEYAGDDPGAAETFEDDNTDEGVITLTKQDGDWLVDSVE